VHRRGECIGGGRVCTPLFQDLPSFKITLLWSDPVGARRRRSPPPPRAPNTRDGNQCRFDKRTKEQSETRLLFSVSISTNEANDISRHEETSGVCGHTRLVCCQKGRGWVDSREGVCVSVCSKGGEEVGWKARDVAERACGPENRESTCLDSWKARDAAERASGDLIRTCNPICTCS